MLNTYDNSDKIINIPINAIKPNPYKVRKFYDITSVSELADSIKEIGLLQPILVRQIKPDSYELISGERRLRGAEIAGFETIKAIVLDVSDNQSAVFALAENVQRKNISVFDEAAAFYHLVFEHEISKEQLARKTGKRETAISQLLRLSRLSPTIKNIIIENNLNEFHALALFALKNEQERITAIKKAIEHNWSSGQLSSYIKDISGGEAPSRHLAKRNVRCAGSSDYKIIFNTINEAIKLVKNAGVKARTRRYEYDKYYEYVIRICK